MKKEKVALGELTLIGISTRTNNKNEINPKTSKIGKFVRSYWANQIPNEFMDRTNPGVTYAVYTEYESNENGDYTYFIGESVNSLNTQDQSKFKSLLIPPSTYQKFTTNPGKIPDIIISSWQAIWQMTEKDLGGKRQYIADFEVYDQRANDLNNAVIDIYIGIK